MQHKINCWQFKNCGREPGGVMANIHGICPVTTAMRFDGLNGGQKGGRVCWKVKAHSLANARQMCCFGINCHTCDFHRRVTFEEADQATPALGAETLEVTD
jgi:hypothetical protein